jgi:hypothetical protein
MGMIMETKQNQTERRDPVVDRTPRAAQAEATKSGVTVRVSVVTERHDEEEKEPGYGYGV